jgi:hypothetical protein
VDDTLLTAADEIDAAINGEIAEAFRNLKGARQIALHNPTADNLRTVEICQEELDGFLDLKLEQQQPRPATV